MIQQTSLEAYQSLSPLDLGLQQKAVYDVICVHGPLTDEQICELTGLQGNSVRPRRGELYVQGLIVPDDYKVTKSGRRAVTWKTKHNTKVN